MLINKAIGDQNYLIICLNAIKCYLVRNLCNFSVRYFISISLYSFFNSVTGLSKIHSSHKQYDNETTSMKNVMSFNI